MSIYQAVNALADRLGINCTQLQSASNIGIFSSNFSLKERRKIIRRLIWEKLLKRGTKERHISTVADNSEDGQIYGVSMILEAYMNSVVSYSEFSTGIEVVKQLPEDYVIHLLINFLLLLKKSKIYVDEDSLSHTPFWRFRKEESKLKEKERLPLRSLQPKIDWEAAKTFPSGPIYRTWESPVTEDHTENEKSEIERGYNYWHRSRVLMGNACFNGTNQISVTDAFRDVTFDEFRSACTSLLIGCSSQIFLLESENEKYLLNPNVYISGLSHDSLASFAEKLFPIAHYFRNIMTFLTSDLATSDPLPFVANWYCLAVKELLHRYLEKVLAASNESSKCEGGFVQLARDYDEILQNTVDLTQLWQTTQHVQLLPQKDANPWCLIGFLSKEALSCSWQTDNAQLDKPLLLEQFLFAEVTNPFLKRLSFAVFLGLSTCRPSLESFGISVNHDQLLHRDLSYWLEGFFLRRELVEQLADHFIPLLEALVSAGRAVEFLKLCKPNHYLITVVNSLSNSLPILEFIPANDCDSRENYLTKHEFFRQDVGQLRESSHRYLEEIRQLTVRAVLDKLEAISRQLKERDEVTKARKLERDRLKQEQKRELRDQQLAETAARRAAKAAAKEKEREDDREMVRRLTEEDFFRTELERRIAEEERRRLIEYYAELERQADWRRAKAEWRTQRLQLTEKRLAFLDEAKQLPTPIFDDSELKAENAPSVARARSLEIVTQQVVPETSEPAKSEHSFKEEDVETEKSLVVEANDNENDDNVSHLSLPVTETIRTPADELVLPIVTQKEPVNEAEEEFINGRDLLNLRKSAELEQETEEQELISNSSQMNKPFDEFFEPENQIVPEPDFETRLRVFDPDRPASLQVFQQMPTSTLSNFLTKRSESRTKSSDKNERRVLTFTELFETCLLQPARAISEMVNFAVVEYLRDQLDIVGHLSALRHYLLMDAGEFAIAVSLPIFEALNSTKKFEYGANKNRVTTFFLETTLGNAVRYASSPISLLLAEERSRSGYEDVFSLQQDFTTKLKFLPCHSELDPTKPFCFDALELTYLVGWPLNIVLPQEDIAIYSRVFSFLLEIYRVVNMLDSCLQLLEDCQQVAKKQAQIVDSSLTLAALRRAHHARCLMRFFFTSIQTYLSSHVLRPQWEQLLREVNSAKSLDDLRKAHRVYLSNLEKRCFLTQSTRSFRGILGRLIRCVLEFNSELKRMASNVISGSGPVKKAHVAKIQAAANDFRANSAHFVAVAAQRVSQFDRLGFLDRLLLQLTFNDFYTCDTSPDVTVIPT